MIYHRNQPCSCPRPGHVAVHHCAVTIILPLSRHLAAFCQIVLRMSPLSEVIWGSWQSPCITPSGAAQLTRWTRRWKGPLWCACNWRDIEAERCNGRNKVCSGSSCPNNHRPCRESNVGSTSILPRNSCIGPASSAESLADTHT